MGLFNPIRMLRRIVICVALILVGTNLTHQLGKPGAMLPPAPADPAVAAQIPNGTQAAVVDRVIDGDTLSVTVVSDGPLPQGEPVTVRLIGIDTPETKKPGAPVDCGGPAASAFTRRLLPSGTQVALVPDAELTDGYGRSLRYVYTRRTFINVRIARAGFARPLAIAPNDRYAGKLTSAVADARRGDRGMWGTCVDPFAPAG